MILSPQHAFDLVKARKIDTMKDGKVSENFTWDEVFTHCSESEIKACKLEIYVNALKQAQTMEQVRLLFHRPILVHSWYRSEMHNIEIGAAPNSFHTKGLATDFHVEGLSGMDACKQVQKRLDKEPFMAKCGLEWTNGSWVHVDSRGYKARFYA